MVQKEFKKKSLAFGIMAILLATTMAAMVYYGYMTSTSMRTFSSQDELNSFIENNTPRGYHSSFEGPIDSQFRNSLNPQASNGFGRMPLATPSAVPMAAPAPFGAFSDIASGPSYSTTNIQVAGVDEADIVKTDGHYIYLLSFAKNSVYIIDANPQNAKVLSTVAFGNSSSLAGIYLSQDSSKLAVLGSEYTLRSETYYYSEDSETKSYTREYFLPEDTKTFVKVYDISDKNRPNIAQDFAASGSYFNSRMIGNYVYAVLSQPVQVINKTVTLPSVCTGTETANIPPSQIHYVCKEDNFYNYFTFTSIIGININNAAQSAANLTIMMGGASNIYVSTNSLYITYPGTTTYSVWGGRTESNTQVYKIRLDENSIAFDAKGSIPGTVLNQYSMDEYNGYFRVATTSWRERLQNNVYILDANLDVVGKLENLASGENIHSARFMGEKCYLVTFKKTDPLFVIDLSQSSYPIVLGELKIPGYSDYLHPFDETHIIGVGKETVEASQGDFAWYQGLKLSLFDVSNVSSPQQMAKMVIGDRGTDSPALSDPKAFLFDNSKSLLVIPVNLALINRTEYEPSASAYGTFVWQGAYVFKLTLTGGFELSGNVTHMEPQLTAEKVSYQEQSSSWITRSLYIDNTLYTISDKKVQLNSLEDLTLLSQIELK